MTRMIQEIWTLKSQPFLPGGQAWDPGVRQGARRVPRQELREVSADSLCESFQMIGGGGERRACVSSLALSFHREGNGGPERGGSCLGSRRTGAQSELELSWRPSPCASLVITPRMGAFLRPLPGSPSET